MKHPLSGVLLSVTTLLLAVGIVAAPHLPLPWSTKPIVKIGLVAPFEGLHRAAGYEALAGVKQALEHHNRKETARFRVELVALNDFNEPDEAKAQAVNMAVDPSVVGVIGHLDAAATLAALGVYGESGLPLVVPVALPSGSGEVYEGAVYPIVPSARVLAAELRRCLDVLGNGGLAIIASRGDSLRADFEREFGETHIEVVEVDDRSAEFRIVIDSNKTHATLFLTNETNTPNLLIATTKRAVGAPLIVVGPRSVSKWSVGEVSRLSSSIPGDLLFLLPVINVAAAEVTDNEAYEAHVEKGEVLAANARAAADILLWAIEHGDGETGRVGREEVRRALTTHFNPATVQHPAAPVVYRWGDEEHATLQATACAGR